jgi:hypothetical protein
VPLAIADFQLPIGLSLTTLKNRLQFTTALDWQLAIGNRQSRMSLRLFMASMLAATATELLKLQPIRCRFLVLGRCVVAALAIGALEHNVIARHNSSPLP